MDSEQYVGNFGFDFENGEQPKVTGLALITSDGKAPDLGRMVDAIAEAVERAARKAKRTAATDTPAARTQKDVVPPTVTIPAEIQALDRDTVLARLEILRQNAKVQYAHRHLSGLSDDELRRLFAHALTLTKRE